MLQQANGSGSGSDSDSQGEGDEWEGFAEPVPVDHEAEYVDEDKYTTVTVEEMGTTRDDFQSNKEYSPTGEDSGDQAAAAATGKSDKPAKPRPKADREKKRKKKFRYESKAERKLTQRKERMSNRKHAKSRQES